MNVWTGETLIKELPPGLLNKLCDLLDAYDQWPTLLGVFTDPFGNRMYSAELVVLLKDKRKYGKSPTAEFLHILSFERTTVETLRSALYTAGLLRFGDMLVPEDRTAASPAAEEDDVLTGPSPSPPVGGVMDERPTATIVQSVQRAGTDGDDTANARQQENEGQRDDDLFMLPVNNGEQADEPRVFSYDELSRATNGFNSNLLIGRGGFGEVFKGNSHFGSIAVKRLMKVEVSMSIERQFQVEVETLARFHHPNILPLYGFSTDGGCYCIVSAYMQNGSLEDRLACLNNTPALTAHQRVYIAQGTVRGIAHLHTFESTPIVHRDIKSANILLDGGCVAKLADCALARAVSVSDPGASCTQTQHVIGTSIYMAPEYKQGGTISVHLDSFSFGVVLLELLTGLPVYDLDRDDPDLPTHVTENTSEGSIAGLTDGTAGWDATLASDVYQLSTSCRDIRRRRPKITEMLPGVEKWKA